MKIRFSEIWNKDPEDNLFKNETVSQKLFCKRFPLMKQILEIETFDKKQSPMQYNHLLEALGSDLQFYINDNDLNFLLTYWQKEYLKEYFEFLVEEWHKEWN